jgi:hypothetical protein
MLLTTIVNLNDLSMVIELKSHRRGRKESRFFSAASATAVDSYSISKSIVSRRQAADSAVARQGEGNNDTIDLEMELVRMLAKCDLFTIPPTEGQPTQHHREGHYDPHHDPKTAVILR